MRSLFFLVIAAMVMCLAFWAYRENYQTQEVLRNVDKLQGEIVELRAAIRIQEAEWAYLNRPNRLRELTELNFERLQLMPLAPQHFGNLEQVAYPSLPELGEITGTIELRGELPDDVLGEGGIISTEGDQP